VAHNSAHGLTFGGGKITLAGGKEVGGPGGGNMSFNSGAIQVGGGPDKGLGAVLGLLGIVGGPLGIAAGLIGFGIGAIGGLKAKKEAEELARERMKRVTEMMVQANTDAAIEQDEIGRTISKAVGQGRVFSEDQENMSLDLRMAEDIVAEGARQNWAVAETNERQQEAMQLAKEDISKDLRSEPKPIMSAVQSMLDLGAAANVLAGSVINAVGSANKRNRQQDKDNATSAINQSVAEGGKVKLDIGGFMNQIMRQRNRAAAGRISRAGGSVVGQLNIFGD